MVWAAIGASAIGVVGGALLSGSKSAGSQAAAGASFAPIGIKGPSGDVTFHVDSRGNQVYDNQGSQIQQILGANSSVANGAKTAFDRFNTLIKNPDPTSALDPGTLAALGGLNSQLNTKTQDFFGNNAGTYQNQAFDANTASNAAFGNLFSGLNGGGQTGFQQNTGQQFGNAAGGALNALGNFDVNSYTANAKAQLDALAAPGDTSATQSLFNKLQGTGRLGLTQNGELGDIGGLALAQNTANNGRALQASQLGLQQQQQLAANASAFGQNSAQAFSGANSTNNSNAGLFSGLQSQSQATDAFGFNRLLGQNNLSTQNALTRFQTAATALGLGNNQLSQTQALGANNTQTQLNLNAGDLSALNASVNASAVRSGANSNAGTLSVSGANNQANNMGSLFAGLAPSLGNGLTSLFGGTKTPTPSAAVNPFSGAGPLTGQSNNALDTNFFSPG